MNRTQNLSLTVTANADYSLVINNPSQSALPSGAVTFNGTLTAFNGYGSTVNLSCGTGAPPTCTPSSAGITPTGGGAAFTISASSNLAQNYTFNIVGQGTDPSGITKTATVTLSSIFDFNLTNSSGAQTTKAGLSATYNLDAAPLGGGNFPNPVTLSCTGLPARSTCSFNPAQVNSGSGDTVIILTVTTNAPIPVSAKLQRSLRLAVYALLLPGLLVIGVFQRWLPKSRRYSPFLLPLMLLMIGLLQACGGGGGAGSAGSGQPGTASGNYSITVSAKSGPLTHTVSAALTV